MRSLRSGIALLQALALGSTLVVWCPCPAAPSTDSADPHACCRKSGPALRSAGLDCCQPCHALRASADAEIVPTAESAASAVVAATAALAPALAAAAARRPAVSLFASPPSLSPPRPLRI